MGGRSGEGRGNTRHWLVGGWTPLIIKLGLQNGSVMRVS